MQVNKSRLLTSKPRLEVITISGISQTTPTPFTPEHVNEHAPTAKPTRRRRAKRAEPSSAPVSEPIKTEQPQQAETVPEPQTLTQSQPIAKRARVYVAQEEEDDYQSDMELFLAEAPEEQPEAPPADPDSKFYGLTHQVFYTYKNPDDYLLTLCDHNITEPACIIDIGYMPDWIWDWRHEMYYHLQPYGFVYALKASIGHIIIMITSNARTYSKFNKSSPVYSMYHIIKKKDLDAESGIQTHQTHLSKFPVDFDIVQRPADPKNDILYVHKLGSYTCVRTDPDAKLAIDNAAKNYFLNVDLTPFWDETNMPSQHYVTLCQQQGRRIDKAVVDYHRNNNKSKRH